MDHPAAERTYDDGGEESRTDSGSGAGYPKDRSSTHWGTQIDTQFKKLVETDVALSGEVVVSPRSLPKGTVAPDVIDVRSKAWWDLTSTADEFAEKIPKYDAQYGKGSSLLWKE